MSIVLKTFFPFFTILSFYTKHMFKFIYVNQVIHIVILVDNVDNFVYNLIISGFADFCHVENFLESFSLIHHDSTGFVHFARIVFFNPIMPAIARSQADIRQADIRNPLRYVALHQITAPQFIRRSLHSSWYKQVPTHCLLLFATPQGTYLIWLSHAYWHTAHFLLRWKH